MSETNDSVDQLVRCRWCGKGKKNFSEWEQQHVTTQEYSRLCVPCANKRLKNPWNALLEMRKIGT
jgi:hypothetical protein